MLTLNAICEICTKQNQVLLYIFLHDKTQCLLTIHFQTNKNIIMIIENTIE